MLIDEDDISIIALVGSIPLLILVIILYFMFSRPEIKECHKQGGLMVKVEGKQRCVDADTLKPIDSKGELK